MPLALKKPAKMFLVVCAILAAGLAAWHFGPVGAIAEKQAVPIAELFAPNRDFQFDPPAPGSYELHRIKRTPDGDVIGIDGRTQRLSDLTEGRITLVSFVYLMCADTDGCPFAISTLFSIHDASAGIPGLREDVQLMTISFDPQRDTVEAIESFAYPIAIDPEADRKLDWHVLTTAGQEQLAPILEGYGQVVDRSADGERISHLLRMYLVDRDGYIRNVYGLGLIDPRLIMTDVETLLMSERRR